MNVIIYTRRLAIQKTLCYGSSIENYEIKSQTLYTMPNVNTLLLFLQLVIINYLEITQHYYAKPTISTLLPYSEGSRCIKFMVK